MRSLDLLHWKESGAVSPGPLIGNKKKNGKTVEGMLARSTSVYNFYQDERRGGETWMSGAGMRVR